MCDFLSTSEKHPTDLQPSKTKRFYLDNDLEVGLNDDLLNIAPVQLLLIGLLMQSLKRLVFRVIFSFTVNFVSIYLFLRYFLTFFLTFEKSVSIKYTLHEKKPY